MPHPIDRCLFDTMGELLKEMILQRLKSHMFGENSLSENQFGFRKGKSTVPVEAIQAVVDIATKARRRTGKLKEFYALISIDIRCPSGAAERTTRVECHV